MHWSILVSKTATWRNGDHFNGSKSSQSINIAELGLLGFITEAVFAVVAGVKGAAETFQGWVCWLEVGGAAGARIIL